MKKFDITLTDDFDRVLLLRERERKLRVALDARERPGPAANDDRTDATDFKDAASEQSLATVDEAQAEQAVSELEQVFAARRLHELRVLRDCGDAIALAHVSAMPATACFTACQATHEGTTNYGQVQ